MRRYGWLITVGIVFVLVFTHRVFVAPLIALPELERLRAENAALHTALIRDAAASTKEKIGDIPSVTARIFSSFPFNTKNILVLNTTISDGIFPGDPATLNGSTLVGEVVSLDELHVSVKTIFDPSWESAVRIGESEADGLLVGGQNPRISMIAKGAAIHEGDAVYSASPLFPYGLYLGKLGSLTPSHLNTFSEAPLMLSYALGELRTLDILLRHASHASR